MASTRSSLTPGMDEDRGLGADKFGSGSDGAAVIAVSCAAEGHLLGDAANLRRVQISNVDWPPELRSSFFQNQSDDRIRTAQGLEAAEAETRALVFDLDRANAKFARQPRQPMQARRLMIAAMGEEAFDLCGCFAAKHCRVGRIERKVVIGMGVEDEHAETLAVSLAGDARVCGAPLK